MSADGAPRDTASRWPTLALVVLAGAALRFITLSAQSLWADEGFTARIASASLSAAVSQVPHTESTPPLYYTLIWVWAHVFGSSAFALRSLSALIGSLTVALVYWAAVPLLGRRVALLGAGLTAVAPILVWYSQEARAYALLVALCVAAFGFFARALVDGRRRWLLGWGLCSAAALATHYFAVFPVAVQACWLVLSVRDRRNLLIAVVPPLVVAVALVPLALYQNAHVPRPWTRIYSVKDQVLAVGQSFLVGITWTPVIHRLAVTVLAILAVAATLALARRGDPDEKRAGLVLAVLTVVALALPVLVSLLGTNYLAPRNVLYAWPLLALLVALGAGRRAAGRVSAAGTLAGGAICTAIVVAVASTPRLQRTDWRSLLRPLKATGISRAVVVFDGFTNDPVIRYYLPGLRRATRPVDVQEVDIATSSKLAGVVPGYLPAGRFTLSSRATSGAAVVLRFRTSGTAEVPAAGFEHSGASVFVEAAAS